jgi:hypothetical protein
MNLDRKTLQEIRDAAFAFLDKTARSERNPPNWPLLFEAHNTIAMAADSLDAMLARRDADEKRPYFTSETCPKCGCNSLHHDFTPEELKNQKLPNNTPCPFCGDESSEVQMQDGGYYVRCPLCAASTNIFKTPTLALTAWMRRP